MISSDAHFPAKTGVEIDGVVVFVIAVRSNALSVLLSAYFSRSFFLSILGDGGGCAEVVWGWLVCQTHSVFGESDKVGVIRRDFVGVCSFIEGAGTVWILFEF